MDGLAEVPESPLPPARCRAMARAGAILAGGISAAVLAGWWLGAEPLVRVIPGARNYPAPNSAACALLFSLSLGLQTSDRGGRWARGAALFASSAALGVVLASCVEHASGLDLGIDGVLLPPLAPELASWYTGRIGRGACVMLLCIGIAQLLLGAKSAKWLVLTTTATVLSLCLSLAGVLGFAFATPGAATIWTTLDMALQTSAAGLLLGLGAILARPDRPLMMTIRSPLAGGFMARRMLAAGLGLPALVAVLEYLAVPSAWLGRHAAEAILVALGMTALAVVVVLACGALNRSDERRRNAEASRALMLDELDHRVKNTLATVLAVCEHTIAGAPDLASFKDAFRGRVRAMALAHEALAARRWDGVCLRRMVETTVAPFIGPGASAVRIQGEDVLLSARAALPVVATVHELATNAAKHGALSRPGRGSRIEVSWTIDTGGTIVLDWVEAASGVSPLGGRRSPEGFGTSLIRGLIPHELKGTTDLTIDATGVRCRMVIPESGRCPEEGERA